MFELSPFPKTLFQKIMNSPRRDTPGVLRLNGRSPRRTENFQLAAAGYEHLEQSFTEAKGTRNLDEKLIDVTEHTLPIELLGSQLNTEVDTKEPGNSFRLLEQEASERLAKDGKNMTPPKKKSALRKYIDPLLTMFNVLLILADYSGVHPSWH
ncbi:hypothetical protein E1B28_003326 [Marasmius oreades]|uniref:Cation-transporting P-type ATPase N-terminal domain-containing protein n=1 Tax=Marasmius oreades TaxID=181124 RepID=A0A9P7RLR1_9AGAR|nr:uncharacterized protein E1B28_003326 [Marasmius oreades]KAG7085785.1 hypothetical protein E1B28_003326 [Marasmius oreades]